MLDGMFTAVVAQLHVRFAVTQDKLPSSQEFLTFIELCNMIFKVDLRFFLDQIQTEIWWKKIWTKKDNFLNCQVCSDRKNYPDVYCNKKIIQQNGLK